MITGFTIENFRGIERLKVAGLGSVNLITGKNDCGKTAAMEAVWAGLASQPWVALYNMQQLRNMSGDARDFDAYWRSLFRAGDAERGATTAIERDQAGLTRRLRIAKIERPQVVKGDDGSPLWTLTCSVEAGSDRKEYGVVGTSAGVQFPTANEPASRDIWNTGRPGITAFDLKKYSDLKQEGKDKSVVEVLRLIDDKVAAIEILAPSGTQASLFVRSGDSPFMLPMQAMGEGVQRCFEFAVGLGASRDCRIFIDEIENGLHHSTLEQVWSWIARVSAQHQLQMFATTHSEECVQAASRAFVAANDDGLRIIRLDRREHETAATVYDRALIDVAEKMGVDLRG